MAAESEKFDENFDFLSKQVSNRPPLRRSGDYVGAARCAAFFAAFLFSRLAAVLRHFKGD